MAAPDLDSAQVSQLLGLLYGHDVGEVELVGAGNWSQCFGFTDGGRHLVVRLGSHAEDFAKDQRAARFAGSGLPVPEVAEVGEAFGGSYAISDRVWGRPIEALDAAAWQRLLPSVFATLDAVAAADVGDTSGYGIWAADGEAPRPSWPAFLLDPATDRPGDRTHGWQAALASWPRSNALVSASLARLTDLADAGVGHRSLVHADLLYRNVLAADDHITGVIDWGCSLYGDPVYDLATLTLWSPWYEGLDAVDVGSAYRRYLADTGRAVSNLDARLICCELHLALQGYGYSALLGADDDVVRIEAQLDRLVS